MNQILQKALCPHRGLGEENSLIAIEAAVITNPFMVEFDIQNIEGTFLLGHPPKINRNATLEDVLSLFDESNVIPKIDLKCSKNWNRDLSLLLEKLKVYKQKTLINIGGDKLSSTEYIDAEKYFTENSNSNLMLNVDIARYKNITINRIREHLKSMRQKPYSLSPMLEGNFDEEIKIASDCGISKIHFWSNNSKNYTQKELLNIYTKYSQNDVSVLFDIKPEIIVGL